MTMTFIDGRYLSLDLQTHYSKFVLSEQCVGSYSFAILDLWNFFAYVIPTICLMLQ